MRSHRFVIPALVLAIVFAAIPAFGAGRRETIEAVTPLDLPSRHAEVASMRIGATNLAAALHERGLEVQSFSRASELVVRAETGLSYDLLALEQPVGEDGSTNIVFALSTVPREVLDLLGEGANAHSRVGVHLQFGSRDGRVASDVSFLGLAPVSATRGVASQNILTEDPCVGCVLDLLTSFACDAAATAITCKFVITCPGAIAQNVIEALLQSLGFNACTQLDIMACANQCGAFGTVSGTPEDKAVLKSGNVPITVKASASSPFKLAGVWVAAIKGDAIGLPAYLDAKADVGWNAEAKFNGWNATAGKWTLLYGAVPGPTGATTLLATKKISVTVEDPTFRLGGVAPANAKISITGPASLTTTANSAGAFLVEGLKAGSYTVSVSKTSCTITPSSTKVTLGPSVTNLSFKGACSYTVTGTVRGAGAGATVTAGGRSTTTNAKDQFTLTQVPEGSQTLVATKSGCEITPVSMSLTVTGDVADRTFTAKCAAAPPAATYSISGNVGVGGVTVSAAGRAVSSDAKGNYTINNVPAGTHKLTAYKPGCSWSPVSLTVTVGPKNATGQNLKPTCK